MQQQVNQMIMQITAGIFGMKHLAEQKKQTPLSPEEQKKRDVEEMKRNEQTARNFKAITNQSIYDSKAAEAIGKDTNRDPKDIQEHLGWAADIAAKNVGKRFMDRRNARAAKEFAQRIAKTPKMLFGPDVPPTTGGDK